jgi:hypothetical protein
MSIKILLLLLLYISWVFLYTTKNIKICGGPQDSVTIRSSSWSAKVCLGLIYGNNSDQNGRTCHGSGRWLLASHRRDPGSYPSQAMWIKWHWDGFSQSPSVFPFNTIPPQASMLTYHLGDEQQACWWLQF